MSNAPVISEPERQRALDAYRVLDTGPETGFDEVANLASAICGTPIALVSLSDRDRQWFKARVGLDVCEIPRCGAFCDLAIQTPGKLMEVSDASVDPRYLDHPLVVAAPHLRFYAGMPLLSPEGAALGTLCVIDPQPRVLSAMQREALASLAYLTMELMAARRSSLQGLRTAAERDFARRRLAPLVSGAGDQAEATLHQVHDAAQALLGGLGLAVSIGAAATADPGEALEYVFARAEVPLLQARAGADGGLVFALD